MRVVEHKMVKAIKARRSWRSQNTVVKVFDSKNAAQITLFDNLLARVFYNTQAQRLHPFAVSDYDDSGKPYVIVANPSVLVKWPTMTTRSRLAALGFGVYIKNFTLHLYDPRYDKEISVPDWYYSDERMETISEVYAYIMRQRNITALPPNPEFSKTGACPYCGAYIIERESTRFVDQSVIARCVCKVCDSRFTFEYEIVRVLVSDRGMDYAFDLQTERWEDA